MKCPFCKSKLVRGENREFENICDHVMNPNQENYPLRPTLICSCSISHDCFWDNQGGFYMGRDSVSYKEMAKYKGSHSALGSWERWQDKEFSFARKIKPLMIFSKYKYDTSGKISRWVFNFFQPRFEAE
jgi:hypothetical protein